MLWPRSFKTLNLPYKGTLVIIIYLLINSKQITYRNLRRWFQTRALCFWRCLRRARSFWSCYGKEMCFSEAAVASGACTELEAEVSGLSWSLLWPLSTGWISHLSSFVSTWETTHLFSGEVFTSLTLTGLPFICFWFISSTANFALLVLLQESLVYLRYEIKIIKKRKLNKIHIKLLSERTHDDSHLLSISCISNKLNRKFQTPQLVSRWEAIWNGKFLFTYLYLH